MIRLRSLFSLANKFPPHFHCARFSAKPAATVSDQPNSNIQEIASQIAKLSLVEVADLVTVLKTTLNIQDIAMPVAAAAAPAPAAGGPAASDAKEAEQPKVKTDFKVTLEKIDTNNKAKTIRELKSILPSLSLVQAKTFVEKLPSVIKDSTTKDDADAIVKAMEAVGATIKVE